jgi:transcription-repair coupling factor (superfamily II helicase)
MGLADKVRAWMDERLVRKFDRFVVLTQEDMQMWGEMPGIRVIPNAANFIAEKYSDCSAKRVIAVGRLDYQKSFDDAFEYDETSAQLEAIDEIKIDMMKPQPMDRLLCGDVGFGKTEIALRAAYKAILGGKQVAILVPTTILALQHYNTAIARMRPFSVNVEMISRFRKPKEQAEILRKLRRGEIDLIIGTHRLISRDIEFADLGLLVVDEEQRFGVKQKERIKQMTENVDVLTLTATPIPRTLNMAMGGIRDISVLDEAPGERLPIQTYVMEHDDAVIEDAIRKEMRRGGQVFYLFNTVDTISAVARRISERIPEARVVYAHGKMEKEELEKIWAEMLMGDIDVLISTTIIETGVDIPNANTLIVENAQNLGLSQLHQLRGRVGRSSRRAYAYFTFPKGKSLTDIAAKRLGAIKEYAQFGAGFKIAMRDLEIRGAGNLLGSEQSGHLNAVGYELFIKLLKEAVLEEKGELSIEKQECVVNLDFDALLPEKYVSSPASRMSMYKKIALIRSSYDVSDIVDELSDRFGDPPLPAMNLVHIAYMKALATAIGIKQIRGDKSRMTFTISDEDFNFEVWMDVSDIFERQVRLSVTGSETMQALIREPKTAIATINKMFEKYLEILKSKR